MFAEWKSCGLEEVGAETFLAGFEEVDEDDVVVEIKYGALAEALVADAGAGLEAGLG